MTGIARMVLTGVLKRAAAYAKDYIQQHWRWGEKTIEMREDTKTEEPGKPKG